MNIINLMVNVLLKQYLIHVKNLQLFKIVHNFTD